MIQQGRIDVHHHVIPPAFTQNMHDNGLDKVAGAPLPKWKPEDSIEVMDLNGIQTAITSLSAPGVYLQSRQQAVSLARQCNEFSADMGQRYPGRFGFFAVLPMPLVDASCEEALYALDNLDADGVVLLGSTRGVFLGNPSLNELMAELNRRSATVFIHPNLHSTSETLGLNLPGFLLEFLCDTTRAATNLILSGTLERYPNINWILSHSGGFLPYIAWRLTLAEQMPVYAEHIPQGVMHYVRRFYYDTALSPSRYSQVALKALVEPEQILFGSDFPFAPAALTRVQCNTMEQLEFWNGEQRYGINRGHALKLFPHYRLDNEQMTANPIQDRNLTTRLQSAKAETVARLAERMRNR